MTVQQTNQPDVASVSRALADRAEQIAEALLGEPTSRSRTEQRWGRRGSLSLRIAGCRRGFWIDHERGEGGDLLDLIRREHDVGFREALAIAVELVNAPINPARPAPRAPTPPACDDRVGARVSVALRTWREAAPIADTLAEQYLVTHRRLDIRLIDLRHALGWHAGIRAIVALMTEPLSGRPCGIHRTYLDSQGTKIERKMLGRQGVIRLAPDPIVSVGLGIAEGLEDALAILLSGWSPVWAATSAGAVARLPVLSGIESLTIFADADDAGERAAECCRSRWVDHGREVRIVYPEGSGR